MSDDLTPAGWVNCKFGDVAKIRNGYAFKSDWFKTTKELPDDVPLVRQSQLKDSTVDLSEAVYLSAHYLQEYPNFAIKLGDILVGMSGSIGKVCRYDVETVSLQNQRTGKIDLLYEEAVESRFLGLFLSTLERTLVEKAKGMGVQNISAKDIEGLPFPLPPLPEQKQIVAKIEELFSELEAGEASLRKALRQLGVYRQSLLKQAFEGKLTAQWRTPNPAKLESPASLLARIQAARQSRYEEQLNNWEAASAAWEKGDRSSSKPRRPSIPDDIEELPSEIFKEMASLPSSWFWGRLGSMTLGVEYGTAAKSSETGACPVIRMGNLQGGEIDWEDLVFTSDETEIAQYQLSPGDVLFNRTNSPELVGKTAIYRGNRPAVFAGYLIRVNQIASVVCSGYLNYFLSSGVAREYGNSVKTDGVNQSNINGAKLAGYPFPYCSLPEQQEIVRLLDEQFEAIERNDRELDAALKRSEALRQSILKKAFTGRLVPQDPADEPAAALLARLRAKREDAPAKTRRRVAAAS